MHFLYRSRSNKVYQPAIAFDGWGAGRGIAHSQKVKNHHHHIYDDDTLENMLRYYKIEENFDTLLRYLKSRAIKEDAT